MTGRELLEPGEEGKVIFVSSYVELKDLAEALRLKPFKVVADLLLMRIFKHSEELIDFETAAIIARKHGFVAKRIL